MNNENTGSLLGETTAGETGNNRKLKKRHTLGSNKSTTQNQGSKNYLPNAIETMNNENTRSLLGETTAGETGNKIGLEKIHTPGSNKSTTQDQGSNNTGETRSPSKNPTNSKEGEQLVT